MQLYPDDNANRTAGKSESYAYHQQRQVDNVETLRLRVKIN